RARAEAAVLAAVDAATHDDARAIEPPLAELAALARRLGDPLLAGEAAWVEGLAPHTFGDRDRAFAKLPESVALLRAGGRRGERLLSVPLHTLAWATTRFDRDFEGSIPITEEALALASRTGARDNEAGTLGQLAYALRLVKKYDRARAALERELVLQRAV